VTENVAFNIIGSCYYLEDGIEENNTLSFNLAAYVHFIGEAPWSSLNYINYQTSTLANPADVTAGGFYISNVHNYVIGNAASGGFAGFLFPYLQRPTGASRNLYIKPTIRTSLAIDGNTAHSTGWFDGLSGAFYFVGSLYYAADGTTLVYNAGRDTVKGYRYPCKQDLCAMGNCDAVCPLDQRAWIQLTNSKAFLTPAAGLRSWSGRLEIRHLEVHDMGISIQALEEGVWVDQMLANCRAGESISMPPGGNVASLGGYGFSWYGKK
jgi:hypothetical protein